MKLVLVSTLLAAVAHAQDQLQVKTGSLTSTSFTTRFRTPSQLPKTEVVDTAAVICCTYPVETAAPSKVDLASCKDDVGTTTDHSLVTAGTVYETSHTGLSAGTGYDVYCMVYPTGEPAAATTVVVPLEVTTAGMSLSGTHLPFFFHIRTII
jgi:hypothetical protein